MFYPISEGKTNAWFSPLIFKKVSYCIIMFMGTGRQLGFAFPAKFFFLQRIILYPRIKSFLNLCVLPHLTIQLLGHNGNNQKGIGTQDIIALHCCGFKLKFPKCFDCDL